MPGSNEWEPGAKHPPPRKHVILLTCMDVRLLDDTVAFMNRFNLANRYDQLVFAGSSLGVLHMSSPPADGSTRSAGATWKDVFFHHLQLAIEVLDRNVSDIFILEHRDCGAYTYYHPEHKLSYDDDPDGQALEEKHHCEQAFLLARTIRDYCRYQQENAREAMRAAGSVEVRVQAEGKLEAWSKIQVRCFLMDLRGDVKHLIEGEGGNV